MFTPIDRIARDVAELYRSDAREPRAQGWRPIVVEGSDREAIDFRG